MAFPVRGRSIAVVAVLLMPALAACGGSSSGARSTASRTPTNPQTVVVPNVVGQNIDTAATAIACAGLKPYPQRITTRGAPTSTKPGRANPPVILTHPSAGTAVRGGTTVYLGYLSTPISLIAVKVTCPA
jgi:hypothetical protein